MLIGVVSDNHRLIDPALPRVLAGVEAIWHAGDLVNGDILPVLRGIAPVVAVRGNNDTDASLRDLPETVLIEMAGHRVLLHHIVGLPPRLDSGARKTIRKHAPDIVVMGHSHRPAATMDAGILFLNPGSSGPRRFALPRTAARLELTPDQAIFTVIDLDSGASTETLFRFPAH